ncbi:indolepyruvate ferredoxin oxidoreductase subunit alpha [Desulfatiferula olefinivorans]
MTALISGKKGSRHLFMGNEAIVRGALEAGVRVAAGYPGTPSSEIIENLAAVARTSDLPLYVEWSVNEKVALEVASAASFAGLRALAVMKQPGLNVAADYLLHLSGSGVRGPMVLVSADDPGALSSVNEGETRPYAKLMEVPLLEPGDFQEAKDMTRWAFELSDALKNLVLLRTVTRLSHASGTVILGEIPTDGAKAVFRHDGFILDPGEGVIMSPPVEYKHGEQQRKLRLAAELFDQSPFNTYDGPEKPELLIITSSTCSLYAREAVHMLGVGERVGLAKLGTTWPLPPRFTARQLARCDRIFFVEEVLPFLEEEIKIFAAEQAETLGVKTFFGKKEGFLPTVGELNPDKVAQALGKILSIPETGENADYRTRAALISFAGSPHREATFCPGCPHRASFWTLNTALSMDNRKGFVCGDIGCYSMAVLPAGFSTLKTLHAMGSGTGVASGFGKLGPFGMDQPVLSVCGDSTFFHSALPALVNAIHNRSDMTLVVLDNSGTAMTGFQPHPGLAADALGRTAEKIDIPSVCRALGAEVRVCDPFDLETARETLLDLIEHKGISVLVFQQPCALSPDKKGKNRYAVTIDETRCVGEACGCNRLCTRIFACPGLVWDKEAGRARIDEVVCAGCGVCASICPNGAIVKTEVAHA